LVDALADVSAEIRLNTRVKTLKRDERGWTITSNMGEQFQADAVCLAVPRLHRCVAVGRHERPPRAETQSDQLRFNRHYQLRLSAISHRIR
jgi:protoporphyrinogen oxidase